MIDRLRQMAIFAKAVDHGSFRGAAAELRLSPSVVSHHISELEAHLGVALMHRTTRKLRLTHEGERLLAATHKMLDAVEGEVNSLSATAGEPSGELRIALPSVLSSSPFIDMVADFMARFPRVSVQLDFSDERKDLIGDGFDIAVRMGLSAKKSQSSRHLRVINRCLVAAPAFLEARGGVAHPNDIQDWPWLELTPLKNMQVALTRNGDRQVAQRRDSQLLCNDAQALYGLARAGVGLAIVPAYLATEDLKAGRIECVLPDWELDPIQMYLDWPVNAPRRGLIRLFADEMGKSDVQI
jgi:DNA-binding transcriptional LysR family regulator